MRNAERELRSVPEFYSFGDVEIDFAQFKVRRKGNELDLTSLELDILKYFIVHRGEVVSRNDLLDKIWGYESYPTTRTIDNHILKMRKKIEDDPSHRGISFLSMEEATALPDDNNLLQLFTFL